MAAAVEKIAVPVAIEPKAPVGVFLSYGLSSEYLDLKKEGEIKSSSSGDSKERGEAVRKAITAVRSNPHIAIFEQPALPEEKLSEIKELVKKLHHESRIELINAALAQSAANGDRPQPIDHTVQEDGKPGAETYISRTIHTAALGGVSLYADCAKKMVEDGSLKIAFCFSRPPGHHAEYDAASLAVSSGGFCIFNNALTAVAYFLEQNKKVSMLDIDVHAGNGTQSILNKAPCFQGKDFFLIDFYADSLFPGEERNQSMREESEKHNPGKIVNVPMAQVTKAEIFNAINKNVASIKTAAIFVVNLGFDAHREDAMNSQMGKLTDEFYTSLLDTLHALNPAAQILFCFEGGYNELVVARVTAKMLRAAVKLQQNGLRESLADTPLFESSTPSPHTRDSSSSDTGDDERADPSYVSLQKPEKRSSLHMELPPPRDTKKRAAAVKHRCRFHAPAESAQPEQLGALYTTTGAAHDKPAEAATSKRSPKEAGLAVSPISGDDTDKLYCPSAEKRHRPRSQIVLPPSWSDIGKRSTDSSRDEKRPRSQIVLSEPLPLLEKNPKIRPAIKPTEVITTNSIRESSTARMVESLAVAAKKAATAVEKNVLNELLPEREMARHLVQLPIDPAAAGGAYRQPTLPVTQATPLVPIMLKFKISAKLPDDTVGDKKLSNPDTKAAPPTESDRSPTFATRSDGTFNPDDFLNL